MLIVDAMRVVKMVPVKKLKPRTFRRWANDVSKYMKYLPGNTVHIVLITIPMNTMFQQKIGRQGFQESLQILTKSKRCPTAVNGSTF